MSSPAIDTIPASPIKPLSTRSARSIVIVGTILFLNFSLRCVHLGHSSIKPLDEVFHAIVARSLLADPLQPTLNRGTRVTVAPEDWQNEHIWLHKPPMAMWQIALSFRVLGINSFALRLPSAVMATATAGVTYLIARLLFDPLTALIALLLQGFNPVLEMLVHGYVFSDHVDISLLFWTELSIWLLLRLLQGDSRLRALLCGAAQGAGFLAKTYPALIVSLLAIATISLLRRGSSRRFSWVNLFWILFGSFLVAGPWNVYAAVNWPQQYFSQQLGILAHLHRDVEGWAGPWDRLIVDYGWRVFGVFYPLLFPAVLHACRQAAKHADRGALFALSWLIFTLVPTTLAISKPMTASLVGWPAAFILLASLLATAIRGESKAIVAFFVGVIGYGLLLRQPVPSEGMGYLPNHHFADIFLSEWQPVTLGIVAALIGFAVPQRHLRSSWTVTVTSACFALAMLCPLGWNRPRSYCGDFWRVSQIEQRNLIDPNLASAVGALPQSAIVLLETRTTLEDKLLQWQTDRDCWPLAPQDIAAWARQLTDRGGLVYVVARGELHYPKLGLALPDGRKLYAASDAAAAAAARQ